MKSILIGLLLVSWIACFPAYTQTDSAYCLPIGKARLLFADALRLRVSDSLNASLLARVDLLQSHQIELHKSYTNLLKIEQDKLTLQKEITAHTESISNTYQEEKKSLKKQVRRLKWQRAGLAAVAIVVVGISL